MPKPVYIYTLVDPRNSEVRYVGITSHLARRMREHLKKSHYTRSHRAHWIRGLLRSDLKPIMRVMLVAEMVDGPEYERQVIRYMLNDGIRLLNKTIGGDGQILQEYRDAIGRAAKKRWENPAYRKWMLEQSRKGAAATREIRKRIPDPRKGTKLSDAHKMRVSEGVRRAMTPEYRAKMSAVKRGKLMYAQTAESKANIAVGVKAYFSNNPKAKVHLRVKTLQQFADPVARAYHKKACEKWAASREKPVVCAKGHDLATHKYVRPSGRLECRLCSAITFRLWRASHLRPSRAKVQNEGDRTTISESK